MPLLFLLFLYCSAAHTLVFALHEHELKQGADVKAYEHDVWMALQNMQVDGLLHAAHLKGFKGERLDRYAVLWIFESAAKIEENFGTWQNPKWPACWLVYENEILAKYLDCHPNLIRFTDYEEIASIGLGGVLKIY